MFNKRCFKLYIYLISKIDLTSITLIILIILCTNLRILLSRVLYKCNIDILIFSFIIFITFMSLPISFIKSVK